MSRKLMYEGIHARLLEIFPNAPWRKAMSKLGDEPSAHKLEENYISYGLCLWESKDLDSFNEYERDAVAQAIFHSGRVLEFYLAASPAKRESLFSRWHAAFSFTGDMRALVLEVHAHSMLETYGWEVEWRDGGERGNTFDFLASRRGEVLQVECKSFAYDKGLYINADEAQKLSNGILKLPFEKNERPEGEICIVTVNVKRKLPSNPAALSVICADIVDRVASGLGGENDGIEVTIRRHDDQPDFRNEMPNVIAREIEGVELSCAVTKTDGDRSRFCLRITTAASEAFWRDFEKICKDAAGRQMQKDQPGALLIHASGLDSARGMLADPRFASKRENIFRRTHLTGIVLVTNLAAYEQENYPYLFLGPKVDEFLNEASQFVAQEIFQIRSVNGSPVGEVS